jgi:hypothetical protein
VADTLWNDGALSRLLTGPDGPVARDLARRAIRVQNQAKINASGRPGPRVRTGRLRSSISWRLRTTSHGTLVADIGTNVFYGRFLETGLRNGRRYPYLTTALHAAH